MATRQTIGDNPLDALIPGPEESGAAAIPASAPPEVTARAEATAPEQADTAAEIAEDRSRSQEPAASSAAGAEAPRLAVPAQCLTFLLAGEEYAVGILQIREIVEYETLTKVPTTPTWIRGVMNLRGTVVPVVDLAVKFGLAETEVTARTCIVIVETDLDGEPTLMGVMVDAVVRVLDLAPEDVEEPPAFGTRVRVDFLLGVGKVDAELVLVLDVDRVLSLDELLAVAAVPAAAAEDEILPADDSADTAAADEGNATEEAPLLTSNKERRES